MYGHRYIDQFRDLLDAPTVGERKDLEVYALAVQTARGEGGVDEWPEEVPKEFVAHVKRSSSRCLDDGGKDVFPITFNYERWLAGI